MKVILLRVVIIGFLLVMFLPIFGIEPNQLCKIFHHNHYTGNNIEHVKAGFEVGKVVFYFKKEPEIRLVSEKQLNEQKKQMVFFFPLATIKSGECMKMVQSIQKNQSKAYTITLEQLKHPAGLQFSICYDSHNIEIAYDTFDAISSFKGLAFTFYDKVLLEDIRKKGNPLIRTASNDHKPYVIIDCGHGGIDTGSIGYGSIKEKDITLQVGLKLANLLISQGINIFLTRDRDIFVPLDKRTCCNIDNPDRSIFVSLHANSAQRGMASGIETFCLSPPLLKRLFKTMDNYSVRLLEYISCEKCRKNYMLANCLHSNVIEAARDHNKRLIDRHVKHSVSQVLLGTSVPSALIELGFLSNEHEAQLLSSSSYQKKLALGIYKGIISYFNTSA